MSNHRTERLRVAAPTLEPDPVFLGVLTELGASSRAAAPSTARSAGLRMIVATASVGVIATATWAAGAPIGRDTPLSPTDSPTQVEPSGPPSPGNVGTPQPDVSTTPRRPRSPGLAGHATSPSARGGAAPPPRRPDDRPGKHKGDDKGHKLGHDDDHGGTRDDDAPGNDQRRPGPEGDGQQGGPVDEGPEAKVDPSGDRNGSTALLPSTDERGSSGNGQRNGTDGDRGQGRGHRR